MQAMMETLLGAMYLPLVVYLGMKLVRGAYDDLQTKFFRIMAHILRFGNAFHLVPRL